VIEFFLAFLGSIALLSIGAAIFLFFWLSRAGKAGTFEQ
jgi:hypothetical protein